MYGRLTTEEINKKKDLLSKLLNNNYPILDIGNEEGHSGYIDFILIKSMDNNNIMKGTDKYNRPFIVFKAEFIFPDNTTMHTFTTFFKRYSDSELLWHACGHDGLNLFDTCGGATELQLIMLNELLSNNTLDLSNKSTDELDNFKLLWRSGITGDYKLKKDIYPTRINIGHT